MWRTPFWLSRHYGGSRQLLAYLHLKELLFTHIGHSTMAINMHMGSEQGTSEAMMACTSNKNSMICGTVHCDAQS